MTSVGEVQTTEAFRVFLPSSSPVSPKKSPGPSAAMTRRSPPSAPATSTSHEVRGRVRLRLGFGVRVRVRARASGKHLA